MKTKNLKLTEELAGYAAYHADTLCSDLDQLYHLLDLFKFDKVEVLEVRVSCICGAAENRISGLSLSSYNLGKMDGDSTFAGDSISAYWCNLSGEFYEDRFNDEMKRLMHQLKMTMNLMDCFRSSMKNFATIVRRQGEESAVLEMALLGKNLFHEVQVTKRLVQGVKILMSAYVKHKKKR
jgi:hypothetical protein